MPITDTLQGPGANAATQSVSLLFNAAAIAQGALNPPFRTQIVPSAQSLDVITIDATMLETHTASSEVTQHPVESGADITDHVRPKPIEVRLDGIISETPIDDSLLRAAASAIPAVGLGLATAQSIQSLVTGASVVRDAYFALMALHDSGQVVLLFTKYRSYSNMVMEQLQITRDPGTGAALHFSATFRQVVLVESATTSVEKPTFAQDSLDTGTQSGSDASASTKLTESHLVSALKPTGVLKVIPR